MKKLYAGTLVFILICAFSSASLVHAENDEGKGDRNDRGGLFRNMGKNDGRNMRGDMKDMRDRREDGPFMYGTVSAVAGSTITFTTKSMKGTTTTYTVDAAQAKIEKNGAASSVSGITVGDMIKVEGVLNGTAIAATQIRVTDKDKSDSFFEGNGEPIIGGTVTAVSGSTITITNKSGVAYAIDASNAKFLKESKTGSLSDIAVGDTLLVQGSINGTAVTASAISDHGMIALKADDGKNRGFFFKIRSFFSGLFDSR
ncbi:MAG: DUF5666 domain-containing protein [Patescibacteria group bacterium]